MNTRRTRIGTNQYKKKYKKHVGLHLLAFIITMYTMTALWLINIPKFNMISPVGSAIAAEASPSATLEQTPKVDTEEQSKEALQEEIEAYIKTIFGRYWKTAIEVQHHECSPQHKLYPKCIKNDEIEYSCSIWQINLRYHAAKVPGDTLDDKCQNLVDDWKLATLIAHKIWSDNHNDFCPWTWYLRNYCQ